MLPQPPAQQFPANVVSKQSQGQACMQVYLLWSEPPEMCAPAFLRSEKPITTAALHAMPLCGRGAGGCSRKAY